MLSDDALTIIVWVLIAAVLLAFASPYIDMAADWAAGVAVDAWATVRAIADAVAARIAQ